MIKKYLTEKNTNLVLLGLFMLFALYCALRTTYGLVLPVEPDDYRDMAIAENMLHGHFFTDPSYQNELLWYNPLLPAFDALIARITGLPMNMVVTHAGKYLNLLIPVSIYYMGCKLFNLKIALATAAASIFFICGNDYGEHTSGYTYFWLAICFSQVIFYLVITFANKTLQHNKNTQFAWLGFFTGILFLCHSAGPFIFCIMLMCYFVTALVKKELSFKQVIFKGLCFSIPFLITSSPLLYNIFIHYHYQIKNVDPTQWVYFLFEPEQRGLFFKETFTIYFFIAMFGLAALIADKQIPKTVKRLILYWFFCSAIVFIYVYSIVILRTKYNINLPGFVPSSDVFFYLKSAEAVLFGVGLYKLIMWLLNKVLPRLKQRYSIAFYTLLVLLVVIRAPAYARRKEFTLRRQQTLELQHGIFSDMKIYEWLKTNTNINDVVLCNMQQANFPVMASGRKMVVAYIYYSSPYVSYHNRKADADSIFSGLQNNSAVLPLLNKYRVNYLLLPVNGQQKYLASASAFPNVVYTDDMFIVRKR